MAEETTTSTTTPVTPAATTPAAVTTPAAARPIGQSNGHGRDKRKGPRGPEIRIPEKEFKKRVNREAAGILMQTLGITRAEAEAKIASKGSAAATPVTPAASTTTAASVAASAVADETLRRLHNENQRLKNQAEQSRRKAEDTERKRVKETQRLRDRQIELELKGLAKDAGINDPDYAIHLYVRAAQADKTKSLKPEDYFGKLKASHAHLFTAPPVVEIPASTAPPESGQPGEVKPKPNPAGAAAGSATVDVDKMNPQEFARHKRSYGFSEG